MKITEMQRKLNFNEIELLKQPSYKFEKWVNQYIYIYSFTYWLSDDRRQFKYYVSNNEGKNEAIMPQ